MSVMSHERLEVEGGGIGSMSTLLPCIICHLRAFLLLLALLLMRSEKARVKAMNTQKVRVLQFICVSTCGNEIQRLIQK